MRPGFRVPAQRVRAVHVLGVDRRHHERSRPRPGEFVPGRQAVVGRHGANFSFEHTDGSRLLGTVAAYEDAPDTRNLRWLLLSTKSYGKGTFGDIAYVQRVNTTGGMPPQRCEAGQLNQLLRVDFSADFVFYRAR